MSRILIDLTDLELWNGNHGGTQRVVYNISKHFYLTRDSLKSEVQFISFSNVDNAFRFTDFANIYERAEAQSTTGATPRGSHLSRKARLKHRLRPYIPEAVRKSQKARQAAVQSIAVGVRLSQKLNRASKNLKLSTKPLAERVSFQKDDIVLVLGKPWDNLKIQDELTEQKAKTGCKLVQAVYDLIISLHPQLHHPSLFTAYTQNMFNAVSNSDLLLPISKSSDRDLKKFAKALNLTVPKTEVIRLGDEIVETADDNLVKPDPRIDNQFIACIGTIEIRKNHMLLYYTYKLGLERGLKLPQLLVVGSRGWLSGDFQYLVEHDPDIKDKILILDTINDACLRWLYKNCLFTVYPSMYEGWGLPVAESLAYGKMCLASNSSSVPEIAGDLIDYFSPYNVEECLLKLTTYLNKTELEKKTALISERYKTTSWQATSEQVLKLLSQLP